MLAHKNRLPLSSRTRLQGKRFAGKYCYLIMSPAAVPYYRLAIIISKKVSASSVIRHRLKRVLVVAIGPELDKLPAADWLLIVKPLAATIPETRLIVDLVEVTGSAARSLCSQSFKPYV